MIKNDVYNAFATPAGQLFFNSGLIAAMENEDDLAGIMAHEIAHVTSRHISQKIERSKKMNLATFAGMAAGIFLGISGASTAANAVSVGTMAAGQTAALAYSREDEEQADQLGLEYLQAAGYDPRGLLRMFRKIRSKQWFGSTEIPTYLSTHPAVEDRLATLGARMEALNLPSKANATPTFSDKNRFTKLRLRMIALYGEPSQTLDQMAAVVKAHPQSLIANYAYGLALARVGRRTEAISALQTALAKNALDPDILSDLGRIYYQDGHFQQALSTLQSSIALSPRNPETLLYLGRTQMALGQLGAATVTLESIIKHKPDYASAYYYLGEVHGKQQHTGRSHYYLGLYYRKQHKAQNAIFHLNRALQTLEDPDKVEECRRMLEVLRKKVAKQKKKTS